MPSPFPGMDPYLERSEIWPDFHDRLITYISEALQPLLRPKYVALTQDRLFVVESDRPIRPDVSIFSTYPPSSSSTATQTLLTESATTVIDFGRDEVRQPYLEIIVPASGNQVVTAIEVLSPDNKTYGAGLISFRTKQDELWKANTNLIEIDLLSAGSRSTRVSRERVSHEINRRYLVTVTRVFPTRCEFYGIDLPQRLPKVSIPLASGDPDVPLDLQAVFSRCYESGPYPQLLYYDGPCPSKLTEQESSLTQSVLKEPT
jgi:hypothetical protein